jgi:hypothetical protein
MPLLDSAHRVVHVTLSGTMFGGNEEWQTGFYVGSATQDAGAPTTAFTDAVRDAWATFFSSQQGNIHAGFKFTTAKAALLNKDGRYAGEAVESHTAAVVSGGAISSTMYPPQVALVATLVAGSGKGLAGKGRMYLPGVNAPLDGTGHIIAPGPQDIANKLAAFFNTVNGSFDVPGEVINMSRGNTRLLGIGARNVPINGVRVGNVFDTQRRRRNGLAETYVAATVAD